jgi:hypothetical protein
VHEGEFMPKRNGSPPITAEMASAIKWLLANSDMPQHHIAAPFGINQGRVSEVKNGKRFNEVPPIKPSDLGWNLS